MESTNDTSTIEEDNAEIINNDQWEAPTLKKIPTSVTQSSGLGNNDSTASYT